MKKIMFHVNSMGKGGAERVIAVLSRYFAEDGYEVVVTTEWEAEDEYVLDKKVRRISVGLTENEEKKNRIIKILLRILRYRREIKKEKPDIVISFCAKANFRSAYAMFGMSTPLLVSVRNDPQVDYAPHRAATGYMEKKAAGCVFQTESAKQFFSVDFQEKSKVIWNPLSEKFLIPDVTGCTEKTHKIVTVGRITKQKNQLLLLEAFAQVREKYPEYQLYIYGEDSKDGSKKALENFIKQNSMQESVCFKGVCPNIETQIHDADMFILSSDYEGMPNALLEAMALGIPVIATDCPCGGPAMMIEDGKSGLLIPVKDKEALVTAMEKLIIDVGYAKKMGEKARYVKQKAHPDRVYQEWKKYVEELV